jgi:hypothetical protein
VQNLNTVPALWTWISSERHCSPIIALDRMACREPGASLALRRAHLVCRSSQTALTSNQSLCMDYDARCNGETGCRRHCQCRTPTDRRLKPSALGLASAFRVTCLVS